MEIMFGQTSMKQPSWRHPLLLQVRSISIYPCIHRGANHRLQLLQAVDVVHVFQVQSHLECPSKANLFRYSDQKVNKLRDMNGSIMIHMDIHGSYMWGDLGWIWLLGNFNVNPQLNDLHRCHCCSWVAKMMLFRRRPTAVASWNITMPMTLHPHSLF